MFTYSVSAPTLVAEPEDIALPQAVATHKLHLSFFNGRQNKQKKRLSLVEDEKDSDTDFYQSARGHALQTVVS